MTLTALGHIHLLQGGRIALAMRGGRADRGSWRGRRGVALSALGLQEEFVGGGAEDRDGVAFIEPGDKLRERTCEQLYD